MNVFPLKFCKKGRYVLIKPFYIDIKFSIDLKLYEGRGTLKTIIATKAEWDISATQIINKKAL